MEDTSNRGRSLVRRLGVNRAKRRAGLGISQREQYPCWLVLVDRFEKSMDGGVERGRIHQVIPKHARVENA